MTDRFDHLNGDQFVKFSAKITVVLFYERNLILQPRCFNTVLGKSVLLVRDGGCGHMHPVVAGRMHGKTTPAGTDFKDPIPGFEHQLLAKSIIFGR